MRIGFRNTKLNFTKHWGVDVSASIIRYFRAVGNCVPDSVRKVISLGIPTSSQEENKGHYSNFNDFQEVYENFMLIHHGEMMALILHGFVPSNEAPEHVRTLGDLFRYSGTMLHTCSPESRMALFGHKFCRSDLTVDRSVPFCSQDGCSFRNFYFTFSSWRANFFPLGTGTSGKQMCETKGPGRKMNWKNLQMPGRQNLCRQTSVRSSRRGSKSWTIFSQRSCHVERLEWKEVASQPWQSQRTITAHCILTGT